MMPWPDLVILFGARAILSLVGIVLIVGGTWMADRVWDDQHSAAVDASANPKSAEDEADKDDTGYQDMEKADKDASDADNNQNTTDTTTEEAAKNYKPLDTVTEFTKSFGSILPTLSAPKGRAVEGLSNAGITPFFFRNSGADDDYRASEQPVPDVEETLAMTKKYSMIAYGGWVLLAFSFVFERHEYFGFDFSYLVVPAFLLQLGLGFAQNFFLRRAVELRMVFEKRNIIFATIGLGYLLSGSLTAVMDREAPIWAAPLGAGCLIVAPIIMYKSRKLGETWDIEGIVNPDPVVFNFGGPLTVLGWFWFWIGLNAEYANPDIMYLPFYYSSRTAFAFVGASFILIVVWMMSYALDEFPDYDNLAKQEENEKDCAVADMKIPAFGVAGRFFGHVSEIKYGMCVPWLVFAIAALLPFVQGIWPFVLFVVVALLGPAFAVWHEQGVRGADWARWKYWGKIVGTLVTLMVFLLCVHGVDAALLAITGTFACMEGMYLLHKDRKRGLHWMETSEVNPNPTVYSMGPLALTFGVLLLAWSMSIIP